MTEEEVHELFSGAPHFCVGHSDGSPQPSVGFPWDRSLQVRDQSDCNLLSDPSFSLSTLRKHLISRAEPGQTTTATRHVEYDIGIVEIPSMISAQGVEPGTEGFEYFLQLPLSDNQYVGDAEDTAGDAYFEGIRNRDLFWDNPEKLGIRAPDLETVVTRLSELCETHHALKTEASGKRKTILDDQAPAELYTNLFGRLLTPPRFDSSADDPTGLKVQIQALIQILSLRGIWKDFALVEWRIRIGQLLWPATVQNGSDSLAQAEEEEIQQQRLALLLQIALASELLVRLDAIAAMDTDKVTTEVHLDASDIEEFRKMKTKKLSWDLVLARRFLENVAVQYVPPPPPLETSPAPQGRLWGLLSVPEPTPASPISADPDVVILPRYQKRQLEGLTHFARSIGWPSVDAFREQMMELLHLENDDDPPRSPASISMYGTPLATPRSGMSQRNSGYFPSPEKGSRPTAVERTSTTLSVQLYASTSAVGPGVPSQLTIGGWLTRSYLTSLVLPGETLSHFLISTLLENDIQAIGELSDNANLYGGFVFLGGSWWSKACVVSRVLACLPGSSESMGWVGLPVKPKNVENGNWVDIWTEDVKKDDKGNRIDSPDKVSADSDLLAGVPVEDTKPADLIIPADQDPVKDIEVRFKGLVLEERPNPPAPDASPDDHPLPDLFLTYTATAGFILDDYEDSPREITLDLHYDVHFVSSYPCTPPQPSKLRIINPSYNPLAFQTSDSEEPTDALTNAAASAVAVPGHPLHESQKFKTVSVADLIDLSESSLVDDNTEIIIVDARASATQELLARSWCAKNSQHALIGRVNRTCLACCVREARALGIKFVIRVDKEGEIDSGSDSDGQEEQVLGQQAIEQQSLGWRAWGRLRGSAVDF